MKISILCLTLSLLFIGCRSETESEPAPAVGNENSSETPVEIPDHLQGVENLSAYSADSRPTHGIEFVSETIFGEIYPTSKPPTIGPKAVVAENGRVFIEDRRGNRIQAYEADGTHIGELGRSGQGPGEFTEITSMGEGNGLVFARDPYQRKINFFSTETLSLSHILQPDPANWSHLDEIRGGSTPGIIKVVSDTSFAAKFNLDLTGIGTNSERSSGYYLLDFEGDIISGRILQTRDDELFNMRFTNTPAARMHPPAAPMHMPFNRKPLVDFSDDDRIFSAWSEDFLINVHDLNGRHLSTIYYPYPNIKLTANDTGLIPGNLPEFFREAITDAELPETWPTLNDLMVDDQQRIWVSTVINNDDVHEWWVLEDSGELITKFRWPKNSRIEEVKNGYLYARDTDEETGIERVTKYRIELTEVSPDI